MGIAAAVIKGNLRRPSALGKKLVFFNDSGDGHFAFVVAIFHPHDSPFTLHADTFRKRDFGWEGQGEADGRATLDRRVEIKGNASRTDVADLSRLGVVRILTARNGNRDPKRKTTCSPFFLLGFCHALLQANKVASD